MIRMTGPDCAVMCNLIKHTHTHTHTHIAGHIQKKKIQEYCRGNQHFFVFLWSHSGWPKERNWHLIGLWLTRCCVAVVSSVAGTKK